MARDIKEILEGTDPAKVAEFTAKAAGATDAAAIKVLAGEYGVELADDEAAGASPRSRSARRRKSPSTSSITWRAASATTPASHTIARRPGLFHGA